MILADKIINERKKNGWSQEELAEKLSVSRQSVSKWEGAQSVPDLQKVIQMADIFGVTTDYLLKDEIGPEEPVEGLREEATSYPPKRKVSMEEANDFLYDKEKYTPIASIGVALCICCAAPLIFLAGLSDTSVISENLAAGIGVVILFLIIAGALVLFMVHGRLMSKYEFLQKEDFETEYGVTGMAKERMASEESKHLICDVLGVVLCILCPVPLLIAAFAETETYIITAMVCVLLVMVAVAVNFFIVGSSVYDGCKMLLREGDYTAEKKRAEKKLSPLASAYWMLATAIFLGYSFITNDWEHSWILWPVAAVLYVVVLNIAKVCMKIED